MSNIDTTTTAAWALALLAHAAAIELDTNRGDEALATDAIDDDLCVAIRLATNVLTKANAPVSDAVAHVIARMQEAYATAYDGKALPEIDISELMLPISEEQWKGRLNG